MPNRFGGDDQNRLPHFHVNRIECHIFDKTKYLIAVHSLNADLTSNQADPLSPGLRSG